MHIHQITDTHLPADQGRLRRYLERLNQGDLGPLPDRIIHTGDLVDGNRGGEECVLREQLQHARGILDLAPVPIHCICHSHDRFGEPLAERGQAFREIIEPELLQHLPLPEADLFLVSASVPFPADYWPEGEGPPPEHNPDWGYDLYDPWFMKMLDPFLQQGSRRQRLLFTHLPIVPGTEPEHPVSKDEKEKLLRYCIGEEGRERVLPWLQKHGITHVFGGHVHLASRQNLAGIEFHTSLSMKTPPYGFRSITVDNNKVQSRTVLTSG